MNLVRRAFLYDTRKKGKTILLFLMLFVMFALVLIALAVRNGAERSAAQLRASLGGSFKLSIHADQDDSRLWKTEEVQKGGATGLVHTYIGPSIDENFIQKVMDVGGVKENLISDDYCLYCKDLQLKPGLNKSLSKDFGDPVDKYLAQTLSLFAVSRGELHEYFRTGAFVMTEGRQIQPDDDHKAVISEELAKLNGLEIGDTITGECNDSIMNGDYETTHGNPISFEIVGLFYINTRLEDSVYTSERDFAENFIFIDKKAGTEIRQNWSQFYADSYSTVTFFVEDPAKLEEVIERVKQLDVDWYYYRISKDDAAYRSSVRPLSTMSTIATILIVLLLIGCVFLLFLIVRMGVLNRKREMGIYQSLGIGKRKILGQLLVELMLIAVLAFGMGWVTAKTFAQPIEQAVLSLVTQDERKLELPKLEVNPFHIVLDVPAQKPEDFQLLLDGRETIAVAGMGSFVLVLSVILAGVPVLKKKPKEVLSLME